MAERVRVMSSNSWKCLFNTSKIAWANPHKKKREVTKTNGSKYSRRTSGFFCFSIVIIPYFIFIK